MTTNIGSTLIQENFEQLNQKNITQVIEETKTQVLELLKKSVPPEFLNRIDETIMFSPLSRQDLRKIADIQFRLVQKRLEENGINIETSEKVLNFLAKAGFDPQFGARPLKRVLQKEILNELSKQILSGKIDKGSLVGIDLNESNQIEFLNLDEVTIDGKV